MGGQYDNLSAGDLIKYVNKYIARLKAEKNPEKMKK
jgi:hypothetical protein